MSRRRGAYDTTTRGTARPSVRSSRRSADEDAADEESRFRRLAAQLGLSRQLQHTPDDDQDDAVEDAHRQINDEGEAEGYDREDDREEEESDFVGEGLESPLTPLRSDYSASESLSSDLSLPRSFGNYDVMRARKPPFDDELQRRTQRNTERNATLIGSASGGGGRQDMMRKFYEAQVDTIRAQLAVVAQAQEHIETTLQEEREQSAKKLQDMEKTLAEERAAWFEERGVFRTELRQLCERLKMEKAHMGDLQISDALAAQLARQQEDDLTVREFVQLHVYRSVRHLQNQVATAQKEIESLRELCAGYKAHAARADDEVAQVTTVADAKALRLQRELELSEASRSELENEIKSMCAQLEVFKDAQARSELESSRRPASVDVYTENGKLQSELQLAGDRHRLIADKNEELRRVVDEQQQQIALLCADKAFLQDAKRQLEDREMRLLAKQKELQSKADLTTAAQLAGAHEMSKVQEETRLAYEKQLAAEIDKFMEISKREIDTIRSNSQTVYERENRLLREARDDALKQIDLLQTRLQSVQASLEEKILESTRMESAHTTALSTSRNDLKMKHFEMNQLGLSLEERSAELRSAKLEIEMLQQKLKVHKEEFARLESSSTMRIAQLESSLETERRRLEEYERLEVDLDDAVLQTGAIGGGLEDVGHGSPPAKQLDEVMATFGAIPTSTKRRFHQSVQLAQRVVKYQKESIELQRQLDLCNAEKRKLVMDVSDMKNQMLNLHQPQSYLIEKLSRKEAELHKLQRANEQLQNQVADLRAEYQQTNVAKMALQAQLQQVLARREELHSLKRTVEALRKKLPTAMDDIATDSVKVQLSPVMLKNPPSPLLMAQMLRPPTAQLNNSYASGDSKTGDPVAGLTPPNWYIKLRKSS